MDGIGTESTCKVFWNQALCDSLCEVVHNPSPKAWFVLVLQLTSRKHSLAPKQIRSVQGFRNHALCNLHAPTHKIFGHYTPTFRKGFSFCDTLRCSSEKTQSTKSFSDSGKTWYTVHKCHDMSRHVTTCHDLLEAQARNGDVTVTQQWRNTMCPMSETIREWFRVFGSFKWRVAKATIPC